MNSSSTGAQRFARHRDLPAVPGDNLIGRDEEVTLLHERLDAAGAGSGHAVLVEGIAGVGKSRLLAELAGTATARGFRVLDARAIEPERVAPFAVALQLFEPTLAGLADDAIVFDGAAELARPLFTGDYSTVTVQSPFPLQHGLFWLTVRLAQPAPVLVCVDDAQWCDEGSVGFLQYLARRVADLPMLLVVAARPAANRSSDPLAAVRESWSGDRIRLAPLTPRDVASLVRATVPEADEGFCAVCAELSGGNPFYVREILHSTQAEALRPTIDNADRLREIGFTSISRASLSRLSRLGPAPADVAKALAVLGDGTSVRLAGSLAGLAHAQTLAAVDALVADRIAVLGASLSFAHPLIGQLVGEDMSAGERALAHGRAARMLAAESAAPEAVTEHLVLAPAGADPWVVDVLRTAAGRARSTGVPAAAVRLLTRAIAEPPTESERAAVLAELGDAESASGLAAGVDHLRQALDLQREPAAGDVTRRHLARALAAQGRRREAAQLLEVVLDGTRSDESTLPALTEYLVNAAFEPGLRQDALARRISVFEAAPPGETSAERELLAVMAMRSGQGCAPATTTVELAERAWRGGVLLEEQGPDGPGWLMTVWALELALDHRRAETVALAAVESARSAGSVEAFATASYFCAWARTRLGRIVEAQADAAQAVGARQHGWRRYLVAALSQEASLHICRGDLEAATQSLSEAGEFDAGGGMEVPWRLQATGHLALARHDIGEALRTYLEAGAWLSDHLGVDYTVLSWRTDAARAALLLGDRDQAAALVQHESLLAQRSSAPGHLGRVARAQGLLVGGEEGQELLRRACAFLAEAGDVIERAETLIDLGSVIRRSGARAEARPALAEALDILSRAGASGPAARAREELAASGARRQTERTSGSRSLTPSELRVAQLAAQGLTNAQVAQSLFVTPKTIEYHLRNVFQKLSISSRTQVAEALSATPS